MGIIKAQKMIEPKLKEQQIQFVSFSVECLLHTMTWDWLQSCFELWARDLIVNIRTIHVVLQFV